MAEPETEEVPNATPDDDSDKPVAILASLSRTVALTDWLHGNIAALSGRSLIAPGDLAHLLNINPLTSSLQIEALSELQKGGDIEIAERVIAGNVAGVIFFQDPADREPDLNLLVRACDIAQVPLALNGATADVALRGIAKTRMAYLIFNPVAGQGDPNVDLATIRAMLEPQLVLTVIMTQPDREAADQTKELVNMIKARPASDSGALPIIIASGGDGTVSAIAGATMSSGIPFAVIPRGTANAFSVALGIPVELKAACRNILIGNIRVVDGAMCNDIPMILLAGLGFEAGMVDKASRDLKNKIGCLAYVLGGAAQVLTQEIFKCQLDIDGKKSELEVGAVTIANVAPPTSVLAQGFGDVNPEDGLFDITIATGKNLFTGLESLSSLLAAAVVKTPTQSDNLLCVRAKTLTISCDPPQKVVIDGEMLEMNPITFTTLPRAITVVAPPSTA